jgi:glutamate synthase (NADPH/NADH) small chain
MPSLDRFAELKPALGVDQALAEANRCLYCYDAPCTRACPTHIDVPAFIKKIASGNPRGAARTILEANILGASCARVCPTEVLCEGACVLNDLTKKPIDIGRLQRHATDWVLEKNERIFSPGLKRGHRVAVVGGGPAGLSCAAELARLGYDVTIFEAGPRPGGLNTVGVAEYKMTAKTALQEINWVLELGVEIKYDAPIADFADLEAKYEAIFVGVGLGKVRDVGIPGEELARDALDLIAELKTDRAGAAAKIAGKRVAVIGGGNTAIDAVTQSARLGAEEVTLVYRRGPEEMSAYVHEVELARHDGVRFLFQAQPVAITKTGLSYVRVAPTDGQRRQFAPIPGSEATLAADVVIKATGQVSRGNLVAKVPNIVLDNGRPVHDPVTMQTGNQRYFVGGDLANGGKEVVNAVAEGKRAARGIHRFLGGNGTNGKARK